MRARAARSDRARRLRVSRPLQRFRDAVALVASGLVAALAIWILVPAWSFPTLLPAVVVPEISPLLAVLAAGAVALAEALARGAARLAAMAVAALACGIALIPALLLPAAIGNANDEMRSALGNDWRIAASDRARARMRPAPVQLVDLLRPFSGGDGVTVERNVPVPNTALALDVYHPVSDGRHPAIVVIYGGAWAAGSRARDGEIASYFAARGYVVLAIDYRHAPAFRWPAQIEDVRAALATIAANAEAWSIDRERVAYLGRSAGAQLALVAAATPNALPAAAVVALYPPTDLVAGYTDPPRPDPAGVKAILRAFLGGPPNDATRTAYVSASPSSLVRRGLPATLLLSGDRDELVRVGLTRAYAQALRANGVRVASLELPWANHAFDEIPTGLGGQFARYYEERFLAGTIGT